MPVTWCDDAEEVRTRAVGTARSAWVHATPNHMMRSNLKDTPCSMLNVLLALAPTGGGGVGELPDD